MVNHPPFVGIAFLIVSKDLCVLVSSQLLLFEYGRRNTLSILSVRKMMRGTSFFGGDAWGQFLYRGCMGLVYAWGKFVCG